MSLKKLALFAFGAMFLQNLIATVMVIFESHFNAPMSGSMEVLYYLASLCSAVLAIGSVLEHGIWHKRSLTIVGAVMVANFVGTFSGVIFGAGLTHHRVVW